MERDNASQDSVRKRRDAEAQTDISAVNTCMLIVFKIISHRKVSLIFQIEYFILYKGKLICFCRTKKKKKVTVRRSI